MSDMHNKPCILCCAITGSVPTKAANPAVPISISEQVESSLAAVEAGARQIECTINGLGERAGNTALEEVVMAMKVRNDILPYGTAIDTTKIMNISRRVASVSGFPVQFNKAIVGKNAFLHESGIHQDGVLKNVETFEIMRPEDIGLTAKNIAMGKHSGRAALRDKLHAAAGVDDIVAIAAEHGHAIDKTVLLREHAKALGSAKDHELAAINSWGDALMHCFGVSDKD